MRVISVVFND